MRVVFDTNVLIDAFADDFSAQARLIEAVREGRMEAVYTSAVAREYRRILHRLIADPLDRERVDVFMKAARVVKPERVDVQIDDPEDYKIAQAAVGGEADVIVTNDRHLLDVGRIGDIRVMTPQECWVAYQEEAGDDEWSEWRRGLGIGL